MKTLLFLFLLLALFACQKDTYDFACQCHYQLVRTFDGCPKYKDLTLEDMYLENVTYKMMHDYENAKQEHLMQDGVLWDVVDSKCHCLPAVCFGTP